MVVRQVNNFIPFSKFLPILAPFTNSSFKTATKFIEKKWKTFHKFNLNFTLII